ncbi:hypothetical protein, partial [Lysobacter sp. 1R34A]|uniref:hypothetical protein n=1 Tax=Lysobacter sp. 1R34A TaxID=3445786 RepID=UPI003EEC5B9B
MQQRVHRAILETVLRGRDRGPLGAAGKTTGSLRPRGIRRNRVAATQRCGRGIGAASRSPAR